MFGSIRSIALLLVVLVLQVVALTSPLANSRTLVIYDSKVSENFKETHVQLLNLLSSSTSGLQVKAINTDEETKETVELFRNGYRLYQNVMIFPTRAKELSAEISSEDLLKFSNDGGDFFIISNQDGTQTDVALFLNELGIYPSPKGYRLIDYHEESKASIESITSPQFLNNAIVPESTVVSKLPYSEGASALLSNSEYLIPVLKASKTSFSHNVDEGLVHSSSTWHVGSQGFLIVGFQGLNNARVTWIGSESIFSDDSFDAELVASLINWTFQITGLIKTEFVNHYKLVDGEVLENDTNYKIKDTSRYEIGISQWDGAKWIPFEGVEDIQLEFVMLDPYYRLNLASSGVRGSAAVYSVDFQIPDQHGMFTYKVDYKRPGYSFIEEDIVVPIRHLANDEYPRSWEIPNAWVYLSSALTVMIAWFFFVVFFIYSGKDAVTSEKKSK